MIWLIPIPIGMRRSAGIKRLDGDESMLTRRLKVSLQKLIPYLMDNGTISPKDEFWVERGRSHLQSQTFTALPYSGYQVDYWAVRYSGRTESVQIGGENLYPSKCN